MSLELGSLQSYCPLETHLYQERLRWKSQQPCYPYHHFWHYPYTFFPFHYSDQVLACFQFRLCVAGSQSVTEVAPPKKWVTSHSQHCTRLKKEIKVAPAASKKEKFVAQWRLCKLRKKKNNNSENGKPFHAFKMKKVWWGERILLENVSTNHSFYIEWFLLLLSGRSCIVAAEKVWWRYSAQLFSKHEGIPILETSCLYLFYCL